MGSGSSLTTGKGSGEITITSCGVCRWPSRVDNSSSQCWSTGSMRCIMAEPARGHSRMASRRAPKDPSRGTM